MHQHSFSQGLSSFFERLTHRLRADAVHYLAFDQLVRQQFQRPTRPSLRRFSAGQGNQSLPRTGYGVGFPLTVQLLPATPDLHPAFQGRVDTLLHAAAAHPFHRRATNP